MPDGRLAHISCSARNANILERRLAVGFAVVMTLKAD
jgi:hypothetical protein